MSNIALKSALWIPFGKRKISMKSSVLNRAVSCLKNHRRKLFKTTTASQQYWWTVMHRIALRMIFKELLRALSFFWISFKKRKFFNGTQKIKRSSKLPKAKVQIRYGVLACTETLYRICIFAYQEFSKASSFFVFHFIKTSWKLLKVLWRFLQLFYTLNIWTGLAWQLYLDIDVDLS